MLTNAALSPGMDFTDLAGVDVADGEPSLALLFGKLDQDLVLAQGDGNLGRSSAFTINSHVHLSYTRHEDAEG